MDCLNDVGSGEDQVVVAAFEAFTAEIFRGEVEALDVVPIAPS